MTGPEFDHLKAVVSVVRTMVDLVVSLCADFHFHLKLNLVHRRSRNLLTCKAHNEVSTAARGRAKGRGTSDTVHCIMLP